ncbi:RagB/SusD family nutrient uptake outer membrane protein [Elizabethkingia sp. JS20170427COW]|uniref:RagB/SusD family nutrient uptake outer membrane protein n=1 Tax=Elizabethkingia sp. JS20170427COW TaxID=2583851 RepID=UPI0011100640|nr:RagB/SusD family nutrient uptake outer membrane protein [Elizabethkingia sp. JS20170427COW]QCX53446.1 RagB/SusD family nutrient uptake outer membrane protein [Elizabethkingia sp. JS20170427COW]
MKYRNIKIGALALSLAMVSVSCSRDFTETVFNESEIASSWKSVDQMHSFVLGALIDMRSTYYYGRDFSIYAEVRSDAMFSNGASAYFNTVYNYTMQASDAYATNTYSQIYKVIAKANNLINFDINSLENAEANKAKATYYVGQAYALRAQGFFDLLRLYGQKYIGGTEGIVMPLTYDPLNKQGRSSVAEVEKQIEADFTAALNKMSSTKGVDNPSNRTEISINAVKALMLRYYLYKEDYAKVSTLVNEIVASNNYKVIDKDALVNSWTTSGTSANSIFELYYGDAAMPGASSYAYVLNSGGYANVEVRKSAYAAYDADDARKGLIEQNSNGQYFLDNKFPDINGGATAVRIVRYEEVLLNGAEAEFKLGNTAKALEYINLIRVNRNLPAAITLTMEDIMAERSKELIGEGFRMWDLLRWGKEIPRPSGASTDKNRTIFPMPRVETDLAGSLVTANPGYDNY